jgi:hypothetical protein
MQTEKKLDVRRHSVAGDGYGGFTTLARAINIHIDGHVLVFWTRICSVCGIGVL